MLQGSKISAAAERGTHAWAAAAAAAACAKAVAPDAAAGAKALAPDAAAGAKAAAPSAPAGGTNATPLNTAAAEAAGRAKPKVCEPEMPGADGALMSDENDDDEDRAPAPTKADSPPRARASTRAARLEPGAIRGSDERPARRLPRVAAEANRGVDLLRAGGDLDAMMQRGSGGG